MKLVVSDLDGTILNAKEEISSETIKAFQNAENSGISVIFATGRSFDEIDALEKYLNYTGIVICSNGAVTYDLGQKKILDISKIESDVLVKIISISKDIFPDISFGFQTVSGFKYEKKFLDNDTFFSNLWEEKNIEDIVSENMDIFKIILKDGSHTSDELMEGLNRELSDISSVTHASPEYSVAEITALGVNKATALEKYLNKNAISKKDVIAFGDMPNDVEMLRMAGKGYAISGGHPHTIASADFLAPSLKDNGVAVILNSIIADI